MDSMIGTMVGNYRLEKLLGNGGMGSVFEATDITLQRQVAIKMMHPHLAERELFQRRFLQEARAIARLEHPNIIKIYQANYEEGQLFLVMELVTRGSLRDYLRHLDGNEKIIQLPEALELVRQMALGLHYAHDQEMVHRDIKPDNVLLRPATTPGQHSTFNILLADFGLAQLANSMVESVSGVAKGTFPYMSPEQCLGERVDQRTDIYALGIVLYELVVGMRPFDPRTLPEAITMHTRQPLPEIASAGRGAISMRVQEIIKRCVEKDPNDRFQTAHEVSRALGLALTGIARGQVDNLTTAPERLDSLVTYLMSQPLPVAAPQHTPISTNQTGRDRLVILNRDEPTRTLTLDADVIRIGRGSDNDLILKSQKIGVSRHHARIERGVDGHYRVIDLKSTNGTFIGDERIEPNRPSLWRPPAVIRIGDYWLQIEPAVAEDDTGFHDGSMPRFSPSIMASTPIVSMTPVNVTMSPPQLTVEPGHTVDAQIEILNRGDRVDHFKVSVPDLPANWVQISPTEVRVMPGQRQSVSLRLAPPRASASRAGTRTFTVRVTSTTLPDRPTDFMGELVISPFYQFTADNQPRRIHGSGIVTVSIDNQGNAPETYVLELRDNEAALKTPPAIPPLIVQPGATGDVQIPLAPQKRMLIGINQTFGYELDVNGQPRAQTLRGDLNARPRIASSLAALAAALLMIACVILTLAITALVDNQNRVNATATAVAIAQIQTATAEFKAAAADATAIWAASDSDADGLTNAQEQEYRTDPENADTDGDGLTDGEEVDESNTKPLDSDSDADGLLDGDEIELHTDPNLRDTDGDGLDDGVEVDGSTNPRLPDSDRDGVNDGLDACHNEAEIGYGYDSKGCPNPPPDTDGDGVADNVDNCRTAGDAGYGVDSNGCPNPAPDPDSDHDGLTGSADQCPSQSGPASNNGCPVIDTNSGNTGTRGPILFCLHEPTAASGYACANPTTHLPSGISKFYYSRSFAGIPIGTRIHSRWYRNGSELTIVRRTITYEGNWVTSSGIQYSWVNEVPAQGFYLSDGVYEVKLWFEGQSEPFQTASMQIG